MQENVQKLLVGTRSAALTDPALLTDLQDTMDARLGEALRVLCSQEDLSTMLATSLHDLCTNLVNITHKEKALGDVLKSVLAIREMQALSKEFLRTGSSDDDRFAADAPEYSKVKTLIGSERLCSEYVHAIATAPMYQPLMRCHDSLVEEARDTSRRVCQKELAQYHALQRELSWASIVGGKNTEGQTWRDEYDGDLGDFEALQEFSTSKDFIATCNPTNLLTVQKKVSESWKHVKELHEAFYMDLDEKIIKHEEGNFEIAQRTLHEGICLREIARVESAGPTEATQAKALLTSMKKNLMGVSPGLRTSRRASERRSIPSCRSRSGA